MITGPLSLRIEQPGREADSPLSGAEIKHVWSFTATPISLRGVVYTDNFTMKKNFMIYT
jgi:hypothetical protein